MGICYCRKCGQPLIEGKCAERYCKPLSVPHNMKHLQKSFLQVMKYNSTIMPESYRRMYLDQAVHREIKTVHSNNTEYASKLSKMATHERVSRMIEILEGIVGVNNAILGNDENRKSDVEYLKNEYLTESNFKLG